MNISTVFQLSEKDYSSRWMQDQWQKKKASVAGMNNYNNYKGVAVVGGIVNCV